MLRKLINFWDKTSLYLEPLFFYGGFAAVLFFVSSFFVPFFFLAAQIILIIVVLAAAADGLLLYNNVKGVKASRSLSERFSIGEENIVRVTIINNYRFRVNCTLIDELPYQLQERNWRRDITLPSAQSTIIEYSIKPLERGAYHFGNINLYVQGPLGLTRRRFTLGDDQWVKVYPSVIQMRRYQLKVQGTHLQEKGVKKTRRLGHSMEFEQIKEYVRGEDYRTINWKATARNGDLMVNNFSDERSQQIYCVINKGRIMKMPFMGMTMLDYAINASLVLCKVAVQKHDKAGLITFAEDLDTFLPADKKPEQINKILEALYKQKTKFLESDFEKLFSLVRNRIAHRSLLVLFTNFETMESLKRELPTLKRLAHYHLLVVVFFENVELKSLIEGRAENLEGIYIKTIAEKFRYEKQLIAKELKMHGITAVLSTPENLTVNSLNKYLEIKKRQLL